MQRTNLKNREHRAMVKRLSIDNLDKKTQTFLKSMQVGKNQYLLESNGKPMLRVVSPDTIEQDDSFSVYNEIAAKNKSVSARQVRKDVAEALKAVSNRTL